MTSVGGCRGVSAPKGRRERAPRDRSGVATAADSLKALVPSHRQPNFYIDLRLDNEGYATESRQIVERRIARSPRLSKSPGRYRLRGDGADILEFDGSQLLACDCGSPAISLTLCKPGLAEPD